MKSRIKKDAFIPSAKISRGLNVNFFFRCIYGGYQKSYLSAVKQPKI